MNGRAKLLELRGKVTCQIDDNDVVHDMLQLTKCFPFRICSLAMSSGYLTVIFSVNSSVYNNVKNKNKLLQ